MTTRKFLGFGAAALILAASASVSQAHDLKFVNITDSTTYVRVNDPDSLALTLDIITDYTVPTEGITPTNLFKMSDMLMSITGVSYDVEGYPSPSSMTDYEGGRWAPANESNTAAVKKLLDSNDVNITYMLWSEQPQIKPLYHDKDVLSMLACNYVYTGGNHGMYYEYCVNYSLKNQQFVYLKDILPGLDTPQGKNLYSEKLVPILTAKAKKVVGSDPDAPLDLLVDEVEPTGNFAFTKDGIVFRYQPYEIAPWAAGVVEVPLTYKEINSIVESVR